MSELEEELLEDKAVLPLELFFDLVFVLGITQTVALVVAGHDGQALGRAFLVLAMLWWAWTQFSWTANAIDLHAPRVRFAFFAAMGAALIMAVSVPTAFEDGGLWLALGYVTVRGIGVWLHIKGTTDQVMLASVKFFALVSWPGPLAIVIGAFFEPPARSWIWLVGFLLEIAAAGLAGSAEWNIRAGHFAERHGLIYIIADWREHRGHRDRRCREASQRGAGRHHAARHRRSMSLVVVILRSARRNHRRRPAPGGRRSGSDRP